MPTPSNKNATPNPYAPTAWGADQYVDLECPSGQLCQVRRPGVEGLISAGLLKETDSLTSLVENKHVKRVKGEKQVDVGKLMNDTDALTKVLKVVDKIVAYIVIQPSLRLPSITGPNGEELPMLDEDREQGVIYTDMVDLIDRMFIFQYAVGGSKDIEQFRKQLNESSGGMAAL